MKVTLNTSASRTLEDGRLLQMQIAELPSVMAGPVPDAEKGFKCQWTGVGMESELPHSTKPSEWACSCLLVLRFLSPRRPRMQLGQWFLIRRSGEFLQHS